MSVHNALFEGIANVQNIVVKYFLSQILVFATKPFFCQSKPSMASKNTARPRHLFVIFTCGKKTLFVFLKSKQQKIVCLGKITGGFPSLLVWQGARPPGRDGPVLPSYPSAVPHGSIGIVASNARLIHLLHSPPLGGVVGCCGCKCCSPFDQKLCQRIHVQTPSK